jgi:hypothetical protein
MACNGAVDDGSKNWRADLPFLVPFLQIETWALWISGRNGRDSMTRQLAFSDPELDLVREVLEGEQKELLLEIRHTDTANFRAGLKERLAMVEALIRRAEALLHQEEMASPSTAQAGTRS